MNNRPMIEIVLAYLNKFPLKVGDCVFDDKINDKQSMVKMLKRSLITFEWNDDNTIDDRGFYTISGLPQQIKSINPKRIVKLLNKCTYIEFVIPDACYQIDRELCQDLIDCDITGDQLLDEIDRFYRHYYHPTIVATF